MPEEPSFQVSYLEAARTALKELCLRAAEKGLADEVLAAIRIIDSRLKQDPRSFGEPKHHYHEMKLILQVAIQAPLVIHFTVHEELPVVFVKDIRSLPNQGF